MSISTALGTGGQAACSEEQGWRMLLRRRACAFIDEEAEVSADEVCSTDEDDGDEDGVLQGLIDDASQPDVPGSVEPARCAAWQHLVLLSHSACLRSFAEAVDVPRAAIVHPYSKQVAAGHGRAFVC